MTIHKYHDKGRRYHVRKLQIREAYAYVDLDCYVNSCSLDNY